MLKFSGPRPALDVEFQKVKNNEPECVIYTVRLLAQACGQLSGCRPRLAALDCQDMVNALPARELRNGHK